MSNVYQLIEFPIDVDGIYYVLELKELCEKS